MTNPDDNPVDDPTPPTTSEPPVRPRSKALPKRTETPCQRRARLYAERRKRIAEARGE